MGESPTPTGVWMIRVALGAFGLTCVLLLLAGSHIGELARTKRDPGYPLTADRAVPQADGTFLMTVDVSFQKIWFPISLGAGKVLPTADSADILIRRNLFRAAEGVQDLGQVDLATAEAKPDGWTRDELLDGEPRNMPLSSWYDYSYWSHLLTTRGKVFAIQLKGGAGVAYLRIESYYCEPEGSGCMTLRYRLE